VEDRGVVYPLMRVRTEGRARLVVTAGFHGNEIAGPLTLARYLPEIVEHAWKREVGLAIYPCVNPSGFDAHTRYNQSGEHPNNDFLRYILPDGEVADVLDPGQPYLRHELFRGGPAETRALRAELETQPV